MMTSNLARSYPFSLFPPLPFPSGNWFLSWNPCEQTVALYSLLKRLPPIQAKFLFHVLQQGPSPTQDLDLNLLEQQANNPGWRQVFLFSVTCTVDQNN